MKTKMSRKTYVKKLMGHGCSRNMAKWLAKSNLEYHHSYANAYNKSYAFKKITLPETSIRGMLEDYMNIRRSLKEGLKHQTLSDIPDKEITGKVRLKVVDTSRPSLYERIAWWGMDPGNIRIIDKDSIEGN